MDASDKRLPMTSVKTKEGEDLTKIMLNEPSKDRLNPLNTSIALDPELSMIGNYSETKPALPFSSEHQK
jgi:hypothetical protein